MGRIHARFVGIELYFDDLKKAKKFYIETMGLDVSDEQVVFEVPDLRSAVEAIGQDRLVQSEHTWAVLHDPEGHNILLLQRSK